MRLLSVALLDLKREFKEPKMFILMLLFPLFFTFVMGLAFGGNKQVQPKIGVAIVDEDKSFFSKALKDGIARNTSLNVSELGLSEAQTQVKDKNISSAVIIPKGTTDLIRSGQKTSVKFLLVPENTDAQGVRQVVEGIVLQLGANAKTADFNTVGKNLKQNAYEKKWQEVFNKANSYWSPEPPVNIEYKELSAAAENKVNGPTGTAHTSMGFAISFVMFTVIFGAGSMLEEREKGTLTRLMSTSTRISSVLGGHLVGTFIIGWMQLLVLILAGQFLFHVDWGRNIPALIVLLSVFLFCITGLGTLISAFVRTTAQLQAVTPIIITSIAMLGGAYWPLEIVPKTMQIIATATPVAWAMRGLTDIVSRGMGFEAIWMPVAVLAAMGMVFFSVGIRFTRFE